MATTVGSATNLFATAAPPSAVPLSSSAINSNLKPSSSPASVTAILPPCEMSMPKLASPPVIGAPMPILIVCPGAIFAQPKASLAHSAGAAPAPDGFDPALGEQLAMTITRINATKTKKRLFILSSIGFFRKILFVKLPVRLNKRRLNHLLHGILLKKPPWWTVFLS